MAAMRHRCAHGEVLHARNRRRALGIPPSLTNNDGRFMLRLNPIRWAKFPSIPCARLANAQTTAVQASGLRAGTASPFATYPRLCGEICQ